MSYAEVMTTDYGKSLVRFDVRDLTEHNRRIVSTAKRKIDRAFRDYIAEGIADGIDQAVRSEAVGVCDRGLAELDRPLVSSRRRNGGGGHCRRIRESPHRGLATTSTRKKADKPPRKKPKHQGRIEDEHHPRTAARAAGQSQRARNRLRERRRNWREIGDRVARLAAAIRALGAKDGDRVAVLSLNSDRYLELYLAAGWAGAVIVPLNIRWSPLENEDAMRDCRAEILFVDKAFAAVGATLAKAIPGLKLVYADDGETPAGMENYEALIAQSQPIADAMRKRDDLAGIFYTGGTTGVPRA